MFAGTFQGRRRQTLERKAAFIAQVTRGDLPSRDVDDLGDQALSFAEVKALATGDPLVLEKAGVDADVARLTRLERAHVDDQHRLRRTHEAAVARADRASQLASQLEVVLARVTDTRGERFMMTVDGRRHTKRVEAGSHLQRLLLGQLDRTPPESTGPAVEVGRLAGLTVTGQAITTIEDEIRLAVPDAHIEVRHPALDWKRSEPSSVITRLERQIQRLPETLEATRTEAEQARCEAERAESRLGAPWDRVDELTRLRRRQQEINEELAAAASKTSDSPVRPAASSGAGVAGTRDSSGISTTSASAVEPSRHEPAASDAERWTPATGPTSAISAHPNLAGVPPPSTSAAAQAAARLDAIQSRATRGGGIAR